MKTNIITIIVIICVCGYGCRQKSDSMLPSPQPEIVWELDGFSNPESVLYDSERNVLFVSNVAGNPIQQDGNGFISQVSVNGKMKSLRWLEGLDAPKGMAIYDGCLCVTDITCLVKIDIDQRKIVNKFFVENAQFLNDSVVGDNNVLYVSDMNANAIYAFEKNNINLFVQNPFLDGPNGLAVKNNVLYVACMGFANHNRGEIKRVNLDTHMLSVLPKASPLGQLDGLAIDEKGNFLVTCHAEGALYRVDSQGKSTLLIDTPSGSADIAYIPKEQIVIIPLMKDNKIVAYKI